MGNGFEDLDLDRLRRRRSEKWRPHPPDVLPAFVAEMDYDLAGPILETVRAAVDLGDCGYATPAGLDAAFAADARAYLLCSPHNPTGRVFSAADLGRVASLAQAHGVLVLSDEIHASLTLPGARHTPFVSLGGAAAEQGVTLASASQDVQRRRPRGRGRGGGIGGCPRPATSTALLTDIVTRMATAVSGGSVSMNVTL